MSTIEYRDFSARIHAEAAAEHRIVNAQIELTYDCNLHCVHCYTDCYNRPELIRQEMSYELITSILDQLAALGCIWVCFTGGEIFVRHDFREIYAYAKQKGFVITLFSNGTVITEALADYLAKYPPFSIELSCHGGTDETFDRITQVRGSFQRFIRGVRLLLERGLPIKIKSKAMTLNRHELDRLQALVEGFGVTFRASTAIYPRLDGDLAPTAYRLSPDEIVALESSVGDDEVSCGARDDTVAVPPPDDRLYRCGCGTTSVHINAWGELGACTWTNVARVDLRRMTMDEAVAAVFPRIHAAQYQSQTPCRSCGMYTFCEKMPATAAAETGDPEQPVEHFCRVAFRRAEAMGIQGECPVDLMERP